MDLAGETLHELGEEKGWRARSSLARTVVDNLDAGGRSEVQRLLHHPQNHNLNNALDKAIQNDDLDLFLAVFNPWRPLEAGASTASRFSGDQIKDSLQATYESVYRQACMADAQQILRLFEWKIDQPEHFDFSSAIPLNRRLEIAFTHLSFPALSYIHNKFDGEPSQDQIFETIMNDPKVGELLGGISKQDLLKESILAIWNEIARDGLHKQKIVSLADGSQQQLAHLSKLVDTLRQCSTNYSEKSGQLEKSDALLIYRAADSVIKTLAQPYEHMVAKFKRHADRMAIKYDPDSPSIMADIAYAARDQKQVQLDVEARRN